MFFGEYRHQIDEKGRFRIPAKLREQLGEHPFITRGANNCLIVLAEDEASKLFEKKFGNADIVDSVNAKGLRLMASSGFPAVEDNQGRILLPQNLIKHSGIIKNVVTIGAYNRVEIWSEENWDKYSNVDAEEFDKCFTNTTTSLEGERK